VVRISPPREEGNKPACNSSTSSKARDYSYNKAMPEQEFIATDEEQHLKWTDAARIAFVAIACAAVWFRVWEPFPRVSIIGLVAALIGMFPILEEAFEAILARRMTMELSMTIAIGAALY
jgi:cation transport ATPase